MTELSIIIPLGKHEQAWQTLLAGLTQLPDNLDIEIILAATDEILGNDKTHEQSVADTLAALGKKPDCPIRICSAVTGRARQLNRAADIASKTWLWFLHADSEGAATCLNALAAEIEEATDTANSLFYFRLGFYNNHSSLVRLNAIAANLRSRLCKTPFGDQGFCIHANTFRKLGGYNEQCRYGEDHLLVWQAHFQQVRLVEMPQTLRTSARKYNDNGWFQQSLVHTCLWLAQAAPQCLKWIRLQVQQRCRTASNPP